METDQHLREQNAADRLEDMAPHGRLVTFAAALDDAAGDLDWRYFLAKPWKWAPEYVEWLRLGLPSEGDEGFDQFADWLESR
jgi:hypothetical protein